jgi:hypothetical protein
VRLDLVFPDHSTDGRAIASPVVAETVVIRVTGPDLPEVVERSVTREDVSVQSSSIQLEIPPGDERTFSVSVRNNEGVELFRGRRTVAIESGAILSLEISLDRTTPPQTLFGAIQSFEQMLIDYDGQTADGGYQSLVNIWGGDPGFDPQDGSSASVSNFDIAYFAFADSTASVVLEPGTYTVDQNSSAEGTISDIFLLADASTDASGDIEDFATFAGVKPLSDYQIDQDDSATPDLSARITGGTVRVRREGQLYEIEWNLQTDQERDIEGSVRMSPRDLFDTRLRSVGFNETDVLRGELGVGALHLSVLFGADLDPLTTSFGVAPGAQITEVRSYSSYVPGSSRAPVGDYDVTESSHTPGVSSYNFGGPVEVTVLAKDGVTTGTTTVYVYYGNVDSQGRPGIIVQDEYFGDVTLFEDFRSRNGDFRRRDSFNSFGLFSPQDIDFDGRGTTFIGDFNSVHPYADHLLTYSTTTAPTALASSLTEETFAVDRVRGWLYFVQSGNTFDTVARTPVGGGSVEQVGPENSNIKGLSVDEQGYVYAVYSDSDGTSVTLRKFNPDNPADNASVSLSEDFGNTILVPGFDYASRFNADLMYRQGRIYMLNGFSDPGNPAILLFDAQPLSFLGGIGRQDADGLDDTADTGEFLGPQRFVAVLNRRIIIADELDTGDTNADRVVYFDGYRVGFRGFGTYGSTGNGNDEFNLFTVLFSGYS